jgi:hypothetical protein
MLSTVACVRTIPPGTLAAEHPDVRALIEFVRPHRAVAYSETEEFGGKIERSGVRETWTGPLRDGPRVVYDVVEEHRTEAGELTVQRVRVFFDETGYGNLAAPDPANPADLTLIPYTPPQLVLPLDWTRRTPWTATHTKGERVSTRSCALIPSTRCPDGIASDCTTEYPTKVTHLVTHFCRGTGFAGQEATVGPPGGASTFSYRSFDVQSEGLLPLP